MSTTTQEILELCERLPGEKQARVANYARLLHEEAARPSAGAKPALIEPDFLERAKRIWGDPPVGEPLSEIVSQNRD